MRRKWEMIGWMLIYVAATPVFACGLPLYSFWYMDDFSWGSTRVTIGEKGQKVVVSDEGKFDPDSIPKKKWEEYQAELWDAQTQRDDRSEMSGVSYATRSYFGGNPYGTGSPGMGPFATPGSEYGGRALSVNGSRPVSQLDLPRYTSQSRMSLAHSGYGFPQGMGGAASDVELNDLGGAHGGAQQMMPSDDALLAEIRDILRTADLMTVTKKSIKVELERRFGVPLESKRQYIGSATEAVLSGQL
ncbi:hypothetical protein LTS18_005512 [Coniosporium uncinatum]|uniref:Uncharacterized protein n=1 Tax=Coniosporium uncinatum TaxID=93489 RepID=A0ACC3D4V9_9PEZI|nr:hypothetical protein LTS18_005512 [Coniosporium uncinatum]